MMSSVRNVSKGYHQKKYRFRQFSDIRFPTSPLVIDCELFYHVSCLGVVLHCYLTHRFSWSFTASKVLVEGLVSVVEVLFVPLVELVGDLLENVTLVWVGFEIFDEFP